MKMAVGVGWVMGMLQVKIKFRWNFWILTWIQQVQKGIHLYWPCLLLLSKCYVDKGDAFCKAEAAYQRHPWISKMVSQKCRRSLLNKHRAASKWKLVLLLCLNVNSIVQLHGNRIAKWRSIVELKLELDREGREGRETDGWLYGWKNRIGRENQSLYNDKDRDFNNFSDGQLLILGNERICRPVPPEN